jgi:hypothetical protein
MAPILTRLGLGGGHGFGFGRRSAAPSGPFSATGGSVLETDTYYVHFFTNVGPNPMVVTGTGVIDCLIVGGGGAGGGGCPGGSGGGGSGAVIYKTSVPVTNGTYTLNVGAGGPAAPNSQYAPFAPYNGGNTTAFGYTAAGGGSGAGGAPNSAGLSGGSGGGGNTNPFPVSIGLPGTASSGHPTGVDVVSPDSGWGNPGGNGASSSDPYAGGGGGGAAGAGVNHPGSWATSGLYGKGGDGARYSISGQPLYYAGGGGGGWGQNIVSPSLYGGVGGLGGGGNGGRSSNHMSSPNTTFPTSFTGSNATQYGAGGGGHGYIWGVGPPGCGGGGAGYQGVVMVRYPKASSPRSTSSLSASGGNVNGLQPGNGYQYHTFTSPGTFTVSSGATDVEILIVGAGGGTPGASGCCIGHGGGGAGGILYGALTVAPGPYSVTIGTGNPGSNGGNTSFGSYTALGGGKGGVYAGSSVPGTPGGSGGGAGWGSAPAPTFDFYGQRGVQTPSGTLTGYGNAGGHSSDFPGGPNPQATNGGGGGAGEAGWPGGGGGSSGNGSGAGGNGLQFPQFTGTLIGVPALNPLSGYFAGGGGSGSRSNGGGGGVGSGGFGGGGTGNNSGGGGAGVTNSGGGGGGPSGVPAPTTDSTGGPGIVVIRYKV